MLALYNANTPGSDQIISLRGGCPCPIGRRAARCSPLNLANYYCDCTIATNNQTATSMAAAAALARRLHASGLDCRLSRLAVSGLAGLGGDRRGAPALVVLGRYSICGLPLGVAPASSMRAASRNKSPAADRIPWQRSASVDWLHSPLEREQAWCWWWWRRWW